MSAQAMRTTNAMSEPAFDLIYTLKYNNKKSRFKKCSFFP